MTANGLSPKRCKMFIYLNLNPKKRNVGDCVVRAISKATGETWDKTYMGVCLKGLELCDMPSANSVWGAYLQSKGFEREIVPNSCPNCYTVADFCKDYPKGTYVLALSSHAVAVVNGNVYDTWDSTSEIPIYFWRKKDDV
ncbi:MAG: hypothetical protein IJK60_05470 [Clostridia bacterium]|nr:hypothetical protein [Clostridia bacterium]